MANTAERINQAWATAPQAGKNPLFEELLSELQGSDERLAEYASVLNEYASYLRVNGRYSYGAEIFERALATIEKVDGKRTAYATCLSNYAELRRLNGEYDACEQMLSTARGLYEDKLSLEYAANLNYEAHLREALKDIDAALAAQAASLAIVEQVDPNSANLACAHQNLGSSYLDAGDSQKALEQLEQAEEIYTKLGITQNAHVVALYNTIGCTYGQVGDADKARQWLGRAVEMAALCKMNPDERAIIERNAKRYGD